MPRIRSLHWFVALIATAAALVSMPAHAQSSRTYVSGLGRDNGPCSSNSPCLTLQRALSQTLPGGQIYALDSANYGAVTINKSVSIITGRGATGVSVTSNVAGITINAGPNDIVNLQGLHIDGGGTGTNGILFATGASLHIQDSVIRGFTTGIRFQPSGSSTLLLENTLVSNNVSGIEFRSASTSTGLLKDVQVINNASGIVATGGSSSAVANLTVQGSVVANNSTVGILAGSFSAITVSNSTLANNGIAIKAESASALLQVSGSSVTGNGTGWLVASGGQVISSSNNSFGGNMSGDTAPPTGPALPPSPPPPPPVADNFLTDDAGGYLVDSNGGRIKSL